MKFQWPKNSKELKQINREQLMWLLSGLKLEQKGRFEDIEVDNVNKIAMQKEKGKIFTKN